VHAGFRALSFKTTAVPGFVWYTWEDGGFFETPPIPLFIAGNIYTHPSIMNAMTRKGVRPAGIDWEQINPAAEREMMANYIQDKIAIKS
jgi:hypothetical protein